MLALGDKLPNFRIDLQKLDATAKLVIDTTKAAYPTLDVPFHSRWRHFDIDIRRSMRRMPSQWRTSGINCWKRASCTPATHSVRAK